LSVHRWLRKDPHCNVYAFLRKLDTLVKCGIFVDGRDIEATLRAVTGYTRFKYAKLLGTEKGGSGKYQRPMYLCLEEKP